MYYYIGLNITLYALTLWAIRSGVTPLYPSLPTPVTKHGSKVFAAVDGDAARKHVYGP